MKKILTILLFLFTFFLSKAQTWNVPRGFPLTNGSYYNYNAPSGAVLIDSIFMMRTASNQGMRSLYPAIKYFNIGSDSGFYYTHGGYTGWTKFGAGGGGGGTLEDAYSAQGATPFGAGYTIDFGGENITHDNIGAYTVNSNSFIELTSGGGTILDLNSGGTMAFQSSTGTYQYSNLNTITNISTIATWSGSNLSKSRFSSVADSLQPYLITPISESDVVWQFQDSTNTPPVSFPAGIDSVYYMIGGAPTGAWTGQAYKIALYVNGVLQSPFITPTLNDWGLVLTGAAGNTWHQYNGSTWPRRNTGPWVPIGNFGGGILGSTNYAPVYMRYANQNRIILQNNGTQFPQLTGASSGLMGLSTTGLASNVQIGSGLLLSGGVLSSTATAPGFQDVLDVDPDVTVDNTVTGAAGVSFTWDIPVQTFNADDSILIAAANKVSLVSLDSLNGRGSVLYFKGVNSWFGGTNIAALFVDSVGIRIQNGLSYMIGTTTGTGSIARIDPTTKALGYSSTINAATELTGIVPVENGGTEVNTIPSGGLMIGAGTSPITTLVGTVVNQVPVWNGTTWTAGTVTNYWQRGQYAALASTNILQQATLTDTVALFSGLGALRAKFNVSGNANITGGLQVGANAAMNATYELDVANDALIQDLLRVNGRASFNTFADPVAGQAMTLGLSNAANGGGLFIGVNAFGQSSTGYGIRIQPTINQTSAAAGTGFITVSAEPGQSNTGTPLSGFITGFNSRWLISSTNATEMPVYTGFRNSIDVSLGTQKTTTAYAFRDLGIVVSSGSAEIVSGNYYGLKLDSTWTQRVGGTIFGINQADNAALDIINILQSKTSIGTTTTPTSFVMVGAGTTANSQLRFIAGVAPTSPNDGDHWYEDTNDRLMFRQNATSVEILGVSAVSSVSPTAQNRTLTIVYNGVTYYLTAKTTND